MNGFVIALGSYVTALRTKAIAAAKESAPNSGYERHGCKVPAVADSIKKIKDRGQLGKKKKTG